MKPIEFKALINGIKRQRRGLKDDELILETLKESIILAIKRRYGMEYPVEVKIDSKTYELSISIQKTVVDKVRNLDAEISLEEARDYVENPAPDMRINVPLDPAKLGRSTVYKIQSIFLQRIKEFEKRYVYKDFESRVGDLITGTIQKIDKTGVYVSLGKAEAIIPPEEQIRGERYRQGGEVTAMVLRVSESQRYPIIVLSRTHPDFLKKLIMKNIPEVLDGTVEIKAVARIPGKRAKVAVYSRNQRVDPVGTCIGPKGTRITKISEDINESIDVVRWSSNILEFTANALSPVKPILVFEKGDNIYAVVKEDEIAKTKGEEGRNIILASRLVGKEIIVISEKEQAVPDKGVSILEIGEKFGKKIENALRNKGYFVFYDIPSLREIMEIPGVTEKEAYKILDYIEDILNKKREND